MIGWLIVAIVVLLILFVLLSKIKFFVEADKDTTFKLSCKLWFIEIVRLPSDSQKDMSDLEPKRDNKSTKKPLEALNISIKTYDDVIELLHTVKNILHDFKKLIKHTVVTKTEFKLVVVGKDAADTAVKYGTVCAAIYPIITLASNCVTFKPDMIDISAGFTENEMFFHLKTHFSVRIIYILVFLISLVKEYIDFKKELK